MASEDDKCFISGEGGRALPVIDKERFYVLRVKKKVEISTSNGIKKFHYPSLHIILTKDDCKFNEQQTSRIKQCKMAKEILKNSKIIEKNNYKKCQSKKKWKDFKW